MRNPVLDVLEYILVEHIVLTRRAKRHLICDHKGRLGRHIGWGIGKKAREFSGDTEPAVAAPMDRSVDETWPFFACAGQGSRHKKTRLLHQYSFLYTQV